MITITGTFTFKDGRKVVSATSAWNNNVNLVLGEILICGDKKWQVVAIDHFRQGCFGVPTTRHHGFGLKPIDHDDQPEVGNVLQRQ